MITATTGMSGLHDLVTAAQAGRSEDVDAAVRNFGGMQDRHVSAYCRWALAVATGAVRSPRTWRVDALTGSDRASGDENAPLRTICEAIARAGPGDTVRIAAGDYRETIEPWRGGEPGRPITLVGDGSGARVLAMDPWNPEWRDEGGGCWSAEYRRLSWDHPEQWGNPGSNRPEHRCEQIWCDGQLQTHHASLESLRATEGGFATVDTSDAAGGRLWLRLQDAPHGRIERSVRRQGLAPLVAGLGHIHVRALTFLGGAAPVWTGRNWDSVDQWAVISVLGGHDWVIEDCDIGYGDAQGVALGLGGFSRGLAELPVVSAPGGRIAADVHHSSTTESGRHLLRRCRIHHNAIAGVVGIGATDRLTIVDNDIEYNGRKRNTGTCEEAGIKIHSARDCLIVGNRVRWNDQGIWLDCECERNRVTGNLLVDNRGLQMFHELSPGPAWFDGNVVIDTTGRSTGFYTHDGSRTLIANNAFLGCATGIRIRALFHRMHGGVSTRTCDNLIRHNLISGGHDACISLMPEKPRNEGNRSDGNIVWTDGQAPRLRQENTGDVGVQWENTAYGRATGRRGGGDALVDLPTWTTSFGLDAASVVLPLQTVVADDPPEQILGRLARAGRAIGLGESLPESWDAPPCDLPGWLRALRGDDLIANHAWTVLTGPSSGLARWEGSAGVHQVLWSPEGWGMADGAALPERVVCDGLPGLSLVGGERLATSVPATGVVSADPVLHASVIDGRLHLAPDEHANPGSYSIITSGPDGQAHVTALKIEPTFSITDIHGDPSPDGQAVLVTVANQRRSAIAVTLTVEVAGTQAPCTLDLPARGRSRVRIPLPVADAGLARVRAVCGGQAVDQEKLVSFALAGHGDWGTTHDLNAFPGGCFPDGAWAFALYQGTITATWRASWDDQGLRVAVDCRHRHHRQVRDDPHGWHTGAAAFVSVRPFAGAPGTEIGMALRSDTGETLCGFRKSIDVTRYPISASDALPCTITRIGDHTAYRLHIPWQVMGVERAPRVGSDLPFSVMVSQNDGSDAYGLQWFFGIDYHHHENDEAWMGRLRLSGHQGADS